MGFRRGLEKKMKEISGMGLEVPESIEPGQLREKLTEVVDTRKEAQKARRRREAMSRRALADRPDLFSLLGSPQRQGLG